MLQLATSSLFPLAQKPKREPLPLLELEPRSPPIQLRVAQNSALEALLRKL